MDLLSYQKAVHVTSKNSAEKCITIRGIAGEKN